MTEPDYADILRRAADNAPLIQELTNALRCALAIKGSLEIANTILAEREKMLRTVLEPFADASRKTDRAWDDNRRLSSLNYEDLRVKHLRAAEMACMSSQPSDRVSPGTPLSRGEASASTEGTPNISQNNGEQN